MINTREIASEYRSAHWSGIMQERQERGQSVREYCKTSGIHENVYYYWQRKLREAVCRELSAQSDVEDKAIVPSGWSVCESSDDKQKPSIVIEIGSFKVSVNENFEPDLLAKVCKALVSIC